MSSQICLKWNSFLNNIALSFESLWEEEGLVDVTLASDGQCLTAHKVILSASSPFFKKVFQTNPCQHPVIILQDVHFTELEALLIFIYKGEVNIEQKNLSALLKAAETLQIRGLSGGDIFPKESYKRLAELDQAVEDVLPPVEETPKKKQKTSKQQNNSILEKALTPQKSQPENTSEPVNADLNVNKDNENPPSSDSLPNPAYQQLEMKLEPFEMTVEELQRQSPVEKEPVERLDTGQTNGTQGVSSKQFVTVIAEARDTSISASELQSENITNESDYDQKDAMEISDVKIEELTSQSPNDSQTIFNPPYACDQEVANESTSTGSSGTSQSPAINGPNSQMELTDETAKSGAAYPPFPCPFCDRAYSSWGFRRRHIKAVHTTSPRLTCKWCFEVLPTHAAWRRHVVSAHNLSATDAHKGLLILEEAHMVLQIAHPTRLDTLVNIIKQSSQCQNPQDPSS